MTTTKAAMRTSRRMRRAERLGEPRQDLGDRPRPTCRGARPPPSRISSSSGGTPFAYAAVSTIPATTTATIAARAVRQPGAWGSGGGSPDGRRRRRVTLRGSAHAPDASPGPAVRATGSIARMRVLHGARRAPARRWAERRDRRVLRRRPPRAPGGVETRRSSGRANAVPRRVAVTFDRHPREVLAPGTEPRLLTTVERKAALIGGCGIDDARRAAVRSGLLADPRRGVRRGQCSSRASTRCTRRWARTSRSGSRPRARWRRSRRMAAAHGLTAEAVPLAATGRPRRELHLDPRCARRRGPRVAAPRRSAAGSSSTARS